MTGGVAPAVGLALLMLLVEAALTTRRPGRAEPGPAATASLRGGLLCLFALAVHFRVLDGSARYLGAAAYLSLAAATSLASWLVARRRARPTRRRSTARVLAGGGLRGFAALLAVTPALLFPQGTRPLPPSGALAVERATVTLTDPARDDPYRKEPTKRTVTVGLWYPAATPGAAPTRRPLVVFSHGGLGVLKSNESLYLELASRGYVVAAVGHTYQALYVREASGALRWFNLAYLRELQREDAKADPAASLARYREWLGVRTGDLEFVIDSLTGGRPAPAGAGPALAQVRAAVDPRRVGVAGHSLGGAAALSLGRNRRDVRAVVALEAPMLGDLVGVRDGEFVLAREPYPAPVLNVYSDATWSRLDELPQYAGNVRLLTVGPATVVNHHVVGANHLSLTDLGLTSPLLTRWLGGRQTTPAARALEEVGRMTLAFLDETLR